MFTISEITSPYSRSTFKSFPSFAEAVSFAKDKFPIIHFELDGDDAADFITKFGTVYAIQAA